MRSAVVGILASLLALGSGQAASRYFTVSITNPVFRVLPGGIPAGGFFTIHNHTNVPIVLMGARSPGCRSIMIHKSSNGGGMSRMDSMTSVTIAVEQRVSFETGGLHLMCMNPVPSMLTDKTVPVTLQFDGGHSVLTTFHLTDARGVYH
jgi:copper(I)-binding protein